MTTDRSLGIPVKSRVIDIHENTDLNEEHIHTAANCYPTLANGVTVTGAAGAWTLGDFVEVVPVSTITAEFDIHWISIEDLSVADTFELVIYAATTEIGRIRVTKGAAQDSTLAYPFQCAIQPANTQIQAKCASSSGGGDTMVISIAYHIY